MRPMYDVAIIGGGMAGLSAAINASADGHRVVVLNSTATLGGQAGSATLIENFLGHSNGITGKDLTENAIIQATKFGTMFKIFDVEHITPICEAARPAFEVHSAIDTIKARSVVLAMGLQWKPFTGCKIDHFMGKGIQYGSPCITKDYKGKSIAIVGGANSAGQAAMYLSQCPDARVLLIIRGDKRTASMSRYLSDRILNCPNIRICTEAEVTAVHGMEKLEYITYTCKGYPIHEGMDEVFFLIGGEPRTEWLKDLVRMDNDGYIGTGLANFYTCYQTSVPGIFAIGDIRAGSVKKVSNAVGEGASVVPQITAYLNLSNIKQSIMSTPKHNFILGTPTKDGWYNVAVRTADDTDHHITVTLYWNGTTWMAGEQYSKSPLKEYDKADQTVAFIELPEYEVICIPCDDESLAEDDIKKRVCKARRRAITVGRFEEEDSALTFLKPLSGGYPDGHYIAIYEDAYGNVSVSVKELEEMTPPYDKVSVEDTELVRNYFTNGK